MGMHVTFDQLDLPRDHADAPYVRVAPPVVRADPIPPGSTEWQPGGGYGTRRPRPATIAAILLIHAGLLAALIKLDVIPVHKPRPAPLVVTLVPEQIAPPPAPPIPPAQPTQEVKAAVTTPSPIVAPAPIVVTPAPAQVATVREIPPPVTAAPAAPAAPSTAPPAPITPPDASAASLNNASPRYPVESRRRREEGTVRLRVVITVDGRVKDISVARTSGFGRLDEAALLAVRKWKFQPGMQAGNPVEAVGYLSIPFKIAA
jgi:protein TonB